MKIGTINVSQWSTGTLSIVLESGDIVSLSLTEDESERFRQLGVDIFSTRQKSIAKEIETARPLLIELQPEQPVEAAPIDLDDDVPF